ncbi:hypothetical protein AAE478_008640 [Parahypoxylon ruwenzoriense]
MSSGSNASGYRPLYVCIDDDDDAPIFRLETRLRGIHGSRQRPIIVDERDYEAEERAENNLEREISVVIDIDHESRAQPQLQPVRGVSPCRNRPIPARDILVSYSYCGNIVREGTVIEIKRRPEQLYFASFLRVDHVYRQGYNVVFRGIPLTRLRFTRGMLPCKRNEVCAILEVDEDDGRKWEVQAAIDVPVEEVIRIRTMQHTNTTYPDFRYKVNRYKSYKDAENSGILTHRWNVITFYKSERDRARGKMHSRNIVRLSESEAEGNVRMPDQILVNRWRWGRIRGGSYFGGRQRHVVVPLEDQPEAKSEEPIRRRADQKYTFGDMFCGAGGASAGARLAGFKVVLACDVWANACETYRLNFPTVDLREMDVFKLVTDGASSFNVDVLHISPPCQVWSPAHTRPGREDDANLAALFATAQILPITRPRIITVEQTFGILHARFREYFNTFINTFTSYNYSVSYRVVNLSTWGVCQPRRRLIVIASCAGEPLPPFPDPTNSDDPADNLPGLTTIGKVLRGINPRRSPTLHNVAEALDRARHPSTRFPLPSYDAQRPLRRTMTTDGGGNYHPSGLRDFTLREYACIQGFPIAHRFAALRVRKQIGNAFPPTAVEVLYRHLHRWLMKIDGVVEAPRGEGQWVDDDSDDDDVVILDRDPREAGEDDDEDDVVVVDVGPRSRSRSSSETLSIGSGVGVEPCS